MLQQFTAWEGSMPYSAEISRTNPGCFIFLLDQSGSMADAVGSGDGQLRKADFLADVVNRALHDLVIRCTRTEEIRDYYHVALIGYGQHGAGVGPAFSGRLSGRTLVPVSEVGEYPARLEHRSRQIADGAGGLVEQVVRFPVWVDPVAGGGTPMCAALQEAKGIVDSWLAAHPHGFPPVVLNITDGESTDGDPTPAGLAVMGSKSTDGDVLLFNCHLSSHRAAAIEYPNETVPLPTDFARAVFAMSSTLPVEFRPAGTAVGIRLVEGARGFVFNADATALVHFFDIGTRPANLR